MNTRRLLSAIILLFAMAYACQAQQNAPYEISGQKSGASEFDSEGSTNFFRNGAVLSNQNATVTMDQGSADSLTGDVVAQGDVTILDHGHVWRGTNFVYNFTTGAVRAGQFKSFQEPFAISGSDLIGNGKTNVYTTTNAVVTTDDYARPAYYIRAKRITISVGEYFEAHDATLYWGKMPVFYFPYYKRSLGQHPNNFEFEPGYRSIYGPYLLSSYNWYGNGVLDGTIHADVRELRGVAGGPDLNLHMGSWGEAAFRYYYANDQHPDEDGIAAPHLNENRQKASFYYEVRPDSNSIGKVVADYQSDPLVIRDFFEGQYQTNVEPNSYAEYNYLWPNYSADLVVQPRLVNFFETVERLPDLKLSGARQEIGESPLFYENESSIGYFKRAFSETNSTTFLTNYLLNPEGVFVTAGRSTNAPPSDYAATRADTFHQFTLPHTFFGWLNVTPSVGGRLTYYSDVDGPAIHTNQQLRAALNTGLETSFKASQIYPDVDSALLDTHELRHIIIPDVQYLYMPGPTRSPGQVPQFDYRAPSLRLLPIDFPSYNDIDTIGATNVFRFMLRNKLQTKRADGIEDLFDWALYVDYDAHPATNHPFSDLYSDVSFRPRSWIAFNSSTRYDLANTRWREAIENIVIQPSKQWSLSLGYDYLINNDPEFQTYPFEDLPGHNLISGSFYYRINENWGFHILERYEAQYGGLQEQSYSIYRDLRSWTAALVFRVTEGPGQPSDYTIGVTFSLKAFPRFGMNSDSDHVGTSFNTTSMIDPPTPY